MRVHESIASQHTLNIYAYIYHQGVCPEGEYAAHSGVGHPRTRAPLPQLLQVSIVGSITTAACMRSASDLMLYVYVCICVFGCRSPMVQWKALP